MHQQHTSIPADGAPLPPIILVVEDDADTRELYSVFFEAHGMWVAGAADPAEAIGAVDELRPDLIVTDVGFHGQPLGLELIDMLKRHAATANVPVILLSGRSSNSLPAATVVQTDLCLVKPVLPAVLAGHVDRLLAGSRTRRRGDDANVSAGDLTDPSHARIARTRASADRVDLPTRWCPNCGRALEWIETGTIDRREYDYYRWCSRGCGLYCFDRRACEWVTLAG